MAKQLTERLEAVKEASRKVGVLDRKLARDIIHEVADQVLANKSKILAANKKDLAKMSKSDPKYDRLLLNKKRLEAIHYDMQYVAEMRSPLNLTIHDLVAPTGMYLRKVTVPLGVVGLVYEARPNVTLDVFSVAIKSGNALVLKGGKDAHETNTAIMEIIHAVLEKHDLANAVYMLPPERKYLQELLEATGLVNVVIPRGGEKLIKYVRENAKVPVIETGAGIVHTYFDETGDKTIGKAIIANAKTRRVTVCNALDTLLIHESRLSDLPGLLNGLDKKHKLQLYADKSAAQALAGKYNPNLITAARSNHYGTEFLDMKLAIKTVSSLQEAIDHINKYGSGHSEAIIAQSEEAIQRFYQDVDAAAVYSNASTAFTDGVEFGLGAEVGISTQKLHARGPMGLRALTSSKWLIEGSGQIRP